MLALGADCALIAMARTNGAEPALAGPARRLARARSDGIVDAAAKTLGGPVSRPIVGPAIGPCCYEVGDEVAGRFRARFGPASSAARMLDLWTAAEQARCATPERSDGRAPRPLHALPRRSLLLRAPHGQAARHTGRRWLVR